MGDRRTEVDWRAVVAAFVLTSASLPLIWVSGEAGLQSAEVRGIDLGLVPWSVLALGLVLGLACLLPAPAARGIVHGLGAVLAGVGTIGVLLVEAAGSAIPEEWIPVTVRRLSVGVSAGLGLWALALSGMVLMVAASGITAPVPANAATLARIGRRARDRWPGVLLLAAALVLGVARYRTWAVGEVAGERIELAGWSLPWIGPATLFGVWAIGLAGVVVLVRPASPALLGALVPAWAASCCSALGILLASAVGGVAVEEAAERLHQVSDTMRFEDPSVVVLPGAWWGFAAASFGCLVIVLAFGRAPADSGSAS